MSTESVSKPSRPSKGRIIGARALTVVAVLLLLVGMLAFYVEQRLWTRAGSRRSRGI